MKGTFSKMVNILRKADGLNKSKSGRKNKLILEEQLLMVLEYLREYCTYFHIGQNYGISESSAYKAVKLVEDTLVKHPNFALPSRKTLMKSDMNYEVVLIDATESPIERLKKTKILLFKKEEKVYTKNSNSGRQANAQRTMCRFF
ncbi:IS5 family transposase ISOt6 [Orientia tsutsugamushi str. Gilliam]|uniref:IS5 family transposase ISOt6 n=2 Tax=Orientia tsutsugamushi str. Gilliam TaxID=1359184 RepID=A0A2U3RCV5_ORITS|nr:IS5 family transposase ISOt6 [Orientia tsutsugamushi str. Gilliam]